MKKKKRSIGPVVEIIIVAIAVSIFCLFMSLIGANGYITEGGTFETTLIVVRNFFSTAGIKHILNNSKLYSRADLSVLLYFLMKFITLK